MEKKINVIIKEFMNIATIVMLSLSFLTITAN